MNDEAPEQVEPDAQPEAEPEAVADDLDTRPPAELAQMVREGNSKTKEGRADAVKWRTRFREQEKEIEEYKRQQMSEHEQALDDAYKKGRAEAEAEWLPKWTEARVTALAAGLLRDPSDALAMVQVDADDTDDTIKGKLAELIAAKPYLALSHGESGDISQGVRSSGVAAKDPDTWLRDTLQR